VVVVADQRENRSGVPSLLRSMGIDVKYRTLAVGDYVVTSGYVIERKTVRDFVNSLFTGRLFDQVKRITDSYGECIVVVEGNINEALDQLSKPRGIWGALISLILDHRGHVFFTANQQETADLLYVIATRQVSRKPVRPLIYKRMRPRTMEDLQLNILGNLPGVGPVLAERLLDHFGSPRGALSAPAVELRKVEGIGRKRAEDIARVLDASRPHKVHEPSQAKLENKTMKE
jgi:DNA excision repair protein ERCC-4